MKKLSALILTFFIAIPSQAFDPKDAWQTVTTAFSSLPVSAETIRWGITVIGFGSILRYQHNKIKALEKPLDKKDPIDQHIKETNNNFKKAEGERLVAKLDQLSQDFIDYKQSQLILSNDHERKLQSVENSNDKTLNNFTSELEKIKTTLESSANHSLSTYFDEFKTTFNERYSRDHQQLLEKSDQQKALLEELRSRVVVIEKDAQSFGSEAQATFNIWTNLKISWWNETAQTEVKKHFDSNRPLAAYAAGYGTFMRNFAGQVKQVNDQAIQVNNDLIEMRDTKTFMTNANDAHIKAVQEKLCKK